MIQFTLSGSIPSINTDLTATMKQVAELVDASVKRNFSEGGRPTAWQALKPQVVTGSNPLMKSGALFNSIENTSDGTSATVSAGQGLPYAMMQNFGSQHRQTINENQVNYFWVMFHRTGDEMWKWMAIKGKYKGYLDMNVPARPFMMFQEDDIEKIMELVGNGLITFTQVEKISA